MRSSLLAALLLTAVSCATAPKPTAESLKIRANTPATFEGRVEDPAGRPVAGIAVRGIPWGEDIPWFPPAVTACDGTFRLRVAAPGRYGFLLFRQGMAVITPSPSDSSRLEIPVAPGESVRGVELIFLDPEWSGMAAPTPPETISCP